MSSNAVIMWIAIVVIPKLSFSFTLNCGLFSVNCANNIINCPSGEDCEIQCGSNYACYQSTINCPADKECLIKCEDDSSCYGLTANAAHASQLKYTGCTASDSCTDMTVYCPPNVNGIKKCIIPGDASLGGEYSPYMQFYAIYGWNDIDFSGYSTIWWSTRRGTMHCTQDYSQSCSIDSGSDSNGQWTCDDRNHICMDPPTPSPTIAPTIITNAPSITPTLVTMAPSIAPTVTTSSPSNFPTNIPSIAPSEFPTIAPSKMPSKTPTNVPTDTPSVAPTSSPSMNPTIAPTVAPTSPKLRAAIDKEKNIDLSDSLEVNNEETTTSSRTPNDSVNATVSDVEHSNFVQTYIKWIAAIAAALIIFNICLCVYIRKRKKNKPKIYHTEHHGDQKDIEMHGNVAIDEDGNETIMPPKKGKIKYSPLGAINLATIATNSNNHSLSIYRESVASQSHQSHPTHPSHMNASGFAQKSSTFTMPNIPPLSMDASSIIPSSASIHTLNAFVLDAQNDNEVFGNGIDAVITPRLEEEAEDGDGINFDDITMQNDGSLQETPSGNVEDDMDKDFDIDAVDVDDVVLNKNEDNEMVNDLNNEVMIVEDGIMTTKGSDEFVVDEITDNGDLVYKE